MNFAIKTCVIAVAFVAVASVVNTGNAEAGNSWRWAKPLNKKVGHAFYTSNRKSTQSRGYTTRKYAYPNRSRVYTQPVYTVPVYHPPIPAPVVNVHPGAPVSTQPFPTGQVIHGPAVPSTKPAVIEQWLP